MELEINRNHVNAENIPSAIEKLENRYMSAVYGSVVTYDNVDNLFKIHIDDRIFYEYNQTYQNGVDYIRKEDFEKAKILFSNIVSSCPIYVKAHVYLSQAYKGLDDYDGALNCLIQALLLDPNNNFANTAMGNLLTLKEQYKCAIRYFQVALEFGGDEKYITESLAHVYLKLNDYKKSIELCEELKNRLYVYNRLIYLTETQAYEGKGQLDKALMCAIDGLKYGMEDGSIPQKDLFEYTYDLCERCHSAEKDGNFIKCRENFFTNLFKAKIIYEYYYDESHLRIDGNYRIQNGIIYISLYAQSGYENDVIINNMKIAECNIRELPYGKYRFFHNNQQALFDARFWKDNDYVLNNFSNDERLYIKQRYYNYLFEMVINCIDSFYANIEFADDTENVHLNFQFCARKIGQMVSNIKELDHFPNLTDEYRFIIKSLCYASICQFKRLYGYDLSYLYNFGEDETKFGTFVEDSFYNRHKIGILSTLKSDLINVFNLEDVIESTMMNYTGYEQQVANFTSKTQKPF